MNENKVTENINKTNLKAETVSEHPLLDNTNACDTSKRDNLNEDLSYDCQTSSLSKYSTTPLQSNLTLSTENSHNEEFHNFQILIIGYEIMEQRTRFTVFKLKIENIESGSCRFILRRYSDFVRLCKRIKTLHPEIIQYLPGKRWIGDNFDPIFLKTRICGLQNLINAVLENTDLMNSLYVQRFFCLKEPPDFLYQEYKILLITYEDTICELNQQLKESEMMIDALQDSLHSKAIENENLRKIIRESTVVCEKCQRVCQDITKSIPENGSSYSYKLISTSASSSSRII